MNSYKTISLKQQIWSTDNLPEVAHLGHGVFETFLVKKANENVGLCFFDRHLKRINAARQELFSTTGPLEKEILLSGIKLILGSNLNQLVRIIAYQDKTFITIKPWEPSLPDNDLKLMSYNASRPLPHLKHCSSIISVLARESALRQGFHEALLVDNDCTITEGAWSSFFWIENHSVVTTKNNVLPGIVREVLLECYPIEQKNITIADLKSKATSAFISQATTGITYIKSIDEKKLEFSSIINELTKLLSAASNKELTIL